MGSIKDKEYIGFITGYKAKNIASIQDTLDVKADEIKDLLSDFVVNNNDTDLVKSVERIVKTLNTKTSDENQIITRFFTVGELLKGYIENLKKASPEKTKKIIYSYSQIAKLT